MKLYKIKAITKERKLLSSKSRNRTNPRLVDKMSKPTRKRANSKLVKKRPLRRLVSQSVCVRERAKKKGY